MAYVNFCICEDSDTPAVYSGGFQESFCIISFLSSSALRTSWHVMISDYPGLLLFSVSGRSCNYGHAMDLCGEMLFCYIGNFSCANHVCVRMSFSH